jgi:hypothetical protein
MTQTTKPAMQTLVGIVTPCEWDENDQVREVSLCATDDEAYLIKNGQRFLDLVQTPIRATGIVTHDTNAQRSISIQNFQMLDYATLFEQVHPGYSRALSGPGSGQSDLDQPQPVVK